MSVDFTVHESPPVPERDDVPLYEVRLVKSSGMPMVEVRKPGGEWYGVAFLSCNDGSLWRVYGNAKVAGLPCEADGRIKTGN
jgi:hypothetical protein